MRRIIVLSTVALLLVGWSATAGIPGDGAQAKAENLFSQEPLKSSVFGLFALRMDGDTVASVNICQKMLPASNVKLITTGVALRTLGSDFHFETGIGYTGEVRDSTLAGDVYIIGGGDPTIGSGADFAGTSDSLFEEWLQILSDHGIKSVEGRIIGDPRFYDDTIPENLGWTYDDLGTSYGIGPSGLNFFENAQFFTVRPGVTAGSRPEFEPTYPDTPWMRYLNRAVTGKAKSGNSIFYINTPLAPYGEFCGEFPIDRTRYTLEASNHFGAYTCAYYFYNYLRDHGVQVAGGFGDVSVSGTLRTDISFRESSSAAPAPGEITKIGSTLSAPLSAIIKYANTFSDNFFVESILKMTGKTEAGSSGYDASIGAVYSVLKSMGFSPDGAYQLVDGSGLSRKNYLSPEFLVNFLRVMTQSPYYGVYLDSLPIPGESGTLESRFQKAPRDFRNRIHVKTGSMNGVRCYSGYLLPSDNDSTHTIAFSLLLNNITGSTQSVNQAVEGIIEALAAEN